MLGNICRRVSQMPTVATEEASRKFWNTMANFYNKHNHEVSIKNYQAIAPFLSLDHSSSVLDAGCGSGAGFPVFEKHGKGKLKLTMIDISDEIVESLKARHGSKAEIRRGNVENLPFKDSQFDAYVGNGLLEVVDNPEWTISEAYRVLKPGGKVGFSLYGRMGICSVLRIYKVISNSLRLDKGTFTPRFELSEPEKVVALLKNGGFEDPLCFYEQYHYPHLTVNELFNVFWENPILTEEAKAKGKAEKLRETIKHEITNLIEVKQEPLIYESLIVIASKPS